MYGQITTINNLKFFELSQNQIDFIKSYTPKDPNITSTLEMKQIISKFGLDEDISTETMRAIRNSVVKTYHEFRTATTDQSERDRLFNSMLSLTAVIDRQMFHINPQSI